MVCLMQPYPSTLSTSGLEFYLSVLVCRLSPMIFLLNWPFFFGFFKKINPSHTNPDVFVGKYSPNLTEKSFNISREYAQIIYDQTSSSKLDSVPKKWEQENWPSVQVKYRHNLARIILVKLFAYQFASPVCWIQTQDLLFTTFNFERRWVRRLAYIDWNRNSYTEDQMWGSWWVSRLKSFYSLPCRERQRDLLLVWRSKLLLLKQLLASESLIPAATSAPVSTHLSGPVASMDDVPIKAINILLVIVAQNLKKWVPVDRVLGLSYLLPPPLPPRLPLPQPTHWQPSQCAHPTLLPLIPTSPYCSDSGAYRDKNVLLSLQLLAYLSKHPHVRQAFYKPRVTFHPASAKLGGQQFGIGSGEGKEGEGEEGG